LSNTILMGEKHVQLAQMKPQPATMDASDFCVYAGRPAFSVGRIGGPNAPLALNQNDAYRNQFGSWHPGVVPMLMGDGSTQLLRTSMSTSVLGFISSKLDGNATGDYQ
jgi:hypothetical protein